MSEHADIASLPFEKALAELEQIVTRLESGKVDLEQSIAIYERGEALKKHCETLLKAAEGEVTRAPRPANKKAPAKKSSVDRGKRR